jgi:hypothetical protein
MSFYEEMDLIKFDVDKLRQDLIEKVMPLGDQIIQGEDYELPHLGYRGFGGWSITSRTGDWRDGWDYFQTNLDDEALEVFASKNGIANWQALKFFNINHSMECDKPTQAYVGEFASIVDQMVALGLHPRRVRVTCLKARSKSLVHRDAGDQDYMCRIHIPIISNKKCVFICKGINLFMEPGKVYPTWVNDYHQIRNDSDEDRYHLICDFYDTKGVTKSFKYGGDINQLIQAGIEWRKNIDATEISPELFEKFEAVRQIYITKGKPNAK